MSTRKERVEIALKAITGQGTADIASANETLGEILSPNFMNKTPYAECLIINLADGKQQAKINYNDSGFLGALEAQWIEEGGTIAVDKAQFATKTIGLGKLAIVVPLTAEISEDIPTLTQYLSKMITRAIRYEVNRSIIYNGGNVKIAGILENSKQATGFVDVSTYTTINAQVNEMYSRYAGSEDGVWIFSKDKYADLVSAYDGDLAFSVERPFGQLWGLPIIVAPYMLTGDVVLGDFSNYVIAQKEMRSSISESVYFSSDQLCLKMVLRIGGKVPFSDGWTNADGYKVYPFVALSDMEGESSSESSSSSSDSSSDSSELSSESSDSSDLSSESSDSSDLSSDSSQP